MIPPPLSIGLTFCNSTIIEEGTRNLTLVGTFHNFLTSGFPFTPPPFHVVAVLVGGHGEGELGLTLTQLETDDELFAVHRRISFADRLKAVRVNLRLKNCLFPAAGAYLMTILVDGDWVAQERFEVYHEEFSV